MIKKLLSLPANLVGSFHNIEHADPNEWFCTSDPSGTKVGSGGGTAWLLEQSYRHDTDGSAIVPERREVPNRQVIPWLAANKRIILHAGGQSRRLPAYAPSGKILTPIPVFRWARGQRIDQNLLELQLPLLEQMISEAPRNINTLIASGDVYIRSTQPLAPIPDVDIVCYGLLGDPRRIHLGPNLPEYAQIHAPEAIRNGAGRTDREPSSPDGYRHMAAQRPGGRIVDPQIAQPVRRRDRILRPVQRFRARPGRRTFTSRSGDRVPLGRYPAARRRRILPLRHQP